MNLGELCGAKKKERECFHSISQDPYHMSIKKQAAILGAFCLSIGFSRAQPVYTAPSCNVATYRLTWDSSPSAANEFNWPSVGALNGTFNDVNGSGINISFAFTGDTGTFGDFNENGTMTPSVGTTASSGGSEVLEYYTEGFASTGNVTITLTFSLPVAELAFDLYHVNAQSPMGDGYAISATTTTSATIYPTFTSSSSPSYATNSSTGYVNATGSSVSGDDAVVGVNFSSNAGITSVTLVWDDCSSCSNGAVHGSGIGSLEFCPVPADLDGDGVADIDDKDDDNDGILDEIESCGSTGGGGSAQSITILVLPDQYANETSWILQDGNGSTVLSDSYSRGDRYTLQSSTLASASGDYTFTIYDSWGDGIFAPGYYEIQVGGTTIIGGSGSDTGDFNRSATETFSVGSSGSFGCLNGDPSADADADGILNYRDADFCTLNGNGVCTSLDTDGDGLIDQFDPDADGDGCSDVIEGGGDFTEADADANDRLTGNVDNDGIPLKAGSSGQAAGNSQNAGVQDENCACTTTDTDGDGICDAQDVDDDNDGILDTEECTIVRDLIFLDEFNTLPTTDLVPDGYCSNDAGANPDDAGTYILTDLTNSPLTGGWRNPSGNDDGTAPAGVSAPSGNFLIFNAFGDTGLNCQEVSDDNNGNGMDGELAAFEIGGVESGTYVLTVFLAELTNTNPHTSSYSFVIYDSENNNQLASIPATNLSNGDRDWQYNEGSFTLNSTTSLMLVLQQTQNEDVGADIAIDNLALYEVVLCEDTDNDTITDDLDTDSDADGCPDALEGSGAFTYADIDANNRLTAAVNASGLPGGSAQGVGTTQNPALQDDECDGCNSNSSLFNDHDGDGVGDQCDLDNDNDGILDLDESCGLGSELVVNGNFENGYAHWTSDFNRGRNNYAATAGGCGSQGWVAVSKCASTNGICGDYYNYDGSTPSGGTLITDAYGTGANVIPTDNCNISANACLAESLPDHTSGGGLSVYVDPNDIAGESYWMQTVSIAANTWYAFSAWIMVIEEDPNLEFKINGRSLTGGLNLGRITAGNDGPDEWQQVSAGWYSGAISGWVVLELSNLTAGCAGNDIRIDDISLKPYLFCDVDSDTIAEYLDVDSDNDKCPDAMEGDGGLEEADLDVNDRLTGSVDSDGVPTSADGGQGMGASQNAGALGGSCCNAGAATLSKSD